MTAAATTSASGADGWFSRCDATLRLQTGAGLRAREAERQAYAVALRARDVGRAPLRGPLVEPEGDAELPLGLHERHAERFADHL